MILGMDEMTTLEKLREWWGWVRKDGWYLEESIQGSWKPEDGFPTQLNPIATEIWRNRKTGRMKIRHLS